MHHIFSLFILVITTIFHQITNKLVPEHFSYGICEMNAETSFSHVALPIFDGETESYDLWAVRMEAYLDALDLWEAVEEDYDVPLLPDNPTMAQIKNHKEKKTKKSKAKACLFSGVSKTVFTRVMTLKTAKEIWDYLKEEYAGDQRIRSMQVINLRREFEMQRMKESETIKEYSDKLLNIANKVKLLGAEFPDSRIVEKILVTLPERYEASIATLENTKDLCNITLAEVLHALKAQEQRRLMRQEGSMEGAFQAKLQINKNGKSRSSNNNQSTSSQSYPPCPHCKKNNHPEKMCWWKPDVKCCKCGQLGHIERICKSQQQQEEVKIAEDESQDKQLFTASCFASNHSTESWLIDSGCTNHMTYDRELFKELDKSVTSKVKIGNGAYIEVKGKGTVAIEGHTGLKLISDVLYVPEINQNLLTVPQLLEKGYKVFFEDKLCMIKDSEGKEVFKVQMKGKSFALNFMNNEQASMHKEVTNTMLWHKRLGHFHHAALIFMKKNNLVKDLPNLEVMPPECTACQYGKQKRLPFPKNKAWRATQKLQLVHTDVGGPMKTPSLNGSKYYIAFIDDYSRMCWIYFMKFKSEVADIFMKFKAWVETQSESKMQVIRSDNGTEYTCEKFNKFCEDAGIEHQLTAPYTPQQNGVVERKNRTIMEMARCVLHDKGLPKKFWAEAANTAVFLPNRLPTKAVQKKTPFEAWHTNKPKLINLKTFGCLCLSYIHQVKRDKLDKKAEPGIFVGYNLIAKAYRIYLPHHNKIIVSMDVKFMEFDSWSWKNDKIESQEVNEDVDDEPVRGVRSLSDIYQRCNVAIMEPAGYEEAATDKKWIDAMKEELNMIEKNQTWKLVDKPNHKKAIGIKWVYRTKLNPDGSINNIRQDLLLRDMPKSLGLIS